MHKHLKVGLFVGLIAAAATVYWPGFQYPTFFDDTNFFQGGGMYRLVLDGFTLSPRWLPYFSMAWTDLVFDSGVLAQRIVNFFIHVLTAFVLYAFVKQLSNHVAPHRNNERAAFAAALLFVLHPLAVYAAGYLIQRTILMATLFGLLSLSAYFDGLVTRKKMYFVLSALFYLLSVFSKEHAILIPLAALALTPLAGPLTSRSWRQLLLPIALYAVIAIMVAINYRGVVGEIYEPYAAPLVDQQLALQSPTLIWGLSVVTQASLFFKYLGMMLIPYPGWMSIDMRVPFAISLWQPKYFLGVLAFLVYGVGALFWLLRGGRRGLVGFALLAPLLLFVVEFSAVRIQEPFVLYRSYLWLAPLFLLLPALSSTLPDKVFWPLLLAVAFAFAYASSDRLHTFSDGYALWDDAVRKLPDERALGSARAYSGRGYERVMRGSLEASLEDFERALRVDPKYGDAYQNRAWVYAKLGDYQAALRDADTLIRIYPERLKAYALRGRIYREMGDYDRAIADYTYACDRKWMGACLALAVTRQQQVAEDGAK